jgi:uncharacterized membrane protein
VFAAYATQWLHLLARWLHVVVGAAWIGTSFYFIWINNSIRPPESPQDEGEKVKGVVWSVHGGAFYRTTKYDGAPTTLPKTLHWFMWEAYLTWMTGAALLTLIYWTQARAFMIDPSVADIQPWQAVCIGVGTLVVGWLVYDLMCRTLSRHPKVLAVVGVVLVTGLAWGLSHLLSPRAAYIHVGAMLGTCMAANVFFVIIPGQRAIVNAMLKGEEPDLSKGAGGALRSLHNNYLTLPVLFVMVSNHFPFTFGSQAPWAVFAAISLIGATIRHWFNIDGRGEKNALLWPAAVIATLALAFVMRPTPPAAAPASAAVGAGTAPSPAAMFSDVQSIIAERCAPCHAAAPTHPSFPAPPAGLILETPAQISANVARIHQQAVVSQIMPLGNLTGMTTEERSRIGQWVDAGTPGLPN